MPSDSISSDVARAADILRSASRIMVITGAGISAESGVPTFRGQGERWRNKHFSELANPVAFARDPREIWDWYLYRRGIVAGCDPNAAHVALARWAQSRSGITLVTQNVDDLHERAGHPDVVRLHGSLWQNRCMTCDAERDERSLTYNELPLSPCCRAPERPAIVWFREFISEDVASRAIDSVQSAEAALVIGTSGVVRPCATYIKHLADRGIPVIEVNPDVTEIRSTVTLRGVAGEIIPLLV